MSVGLNETLSCSHQVWGFCQELHNSHSNLTESKSRGLKFPAGSPDHLHHRDPLECPVQLVPYVSNSANFGNRYEIMKNYKQVSEILSEHVNGHNRSFEDVPSAHNIERCNVKING